MLMTNLQERRTKRRVVLELACLVDMAFLLLIFFLLVTLLPYSSVDSESFLKSSTLSPQNHLQIHCAPSSPIVVQDNPITLESLPTLLQRYNDKKTKVSIVVADPLYVQRLVDVMDLLVSQEYYNIQVLIQPTQ